MAIVASPFRLGLALERPLQQFHRALARRIWIVASAPILYPALAALALFGQILVAIDKTRAIRAEARQLASAIAALSGDDRREKAVQLIRRFRHENPAHEWFRLQCMGVVGAAEEERIDHALREVHLEGTIYFSERVKRTVKALLGQALEIQKMYGSTHHVFLHAQSTRRVVFTHLVKELIRKHHPQEKIRHFKFLRAPCETADSGAIESVIRFVSHLWNPKQDVQRYASRWFVSDKDAKVREELLSVDAFFYNYSRCESAIHFLVNNLNMLDSDVRKTAEKTLRHFYPALSEEWLSQTAERVANVPFDEPACGHLFAICIPKEESDKLHYRSHPFGRPCHCHPAEQNLPILEQLQQGIFDSATKCKIEPAVPQYRIYLPLLKPDGDHRIFLFSPMTQVDRKELKRQIRLIA